MPSVNTDLAVALVGAGPRGTSVLERLCASAPELLPPGVRLTVHVVDPAPPGPGRVWRTVQSPELLMNTVASQVTLFTDDSVDCAGPIRPHYGRYRTLAQCAILQGGGVGHPARSSPEGRSGMAKIALSDNGVVGPTAGRAGSQACGGRVRPTLTGRRWPVKQEPMVVPRSGTDRNPLPSGRGGRQLEWVFARTVRQAPPSVRVETHAASAVRLDDAADGRQLLTLDSVPVPHGLRYVPSGHEPRLYAGSRRGIPYQARGDNAKGPYGRHTPRVLTPEVIAGFRKRADSGEAPDFLAEIWPLVAKEVETVYYAALVRHAAFLDRFLAVPHRAPQEALMLDEFGVPEAARWSWERISRPYGERRFAHPGQWRDWLLAYLRRDAAEAARGNVDGPSKAALDVLRDLRNELRLIVDHAGLAGASRRDHLDRWYTPLNAFLSIGPPRRRVEELAALVEAGVVEVLGPRLEVREEDGAWRAHSPQVPGSAVRVRTLIEARLPETDVRRTADTLLARLLRTGQCRPHTVDGYETGGLDVTQRPYRLIDRQGRAHARRFAFGVPTEGVHWVTAAGARPGVDSVTLSDADAVARAVLRAAKAETEPQTEPKSWPKVELESIY
ncbi:MULTISPECIES: FAD/NAD(P)-binding protein [Streptomyces]|uniref:FAD/NAD(P)-binding protein n=1 Tax=Streptomyces sp. 900129855 TaxID=3155129 RepID=A0ABV2ZIP8_9ACTN